MKLKYYLTEKKFTRFDTKRLRGVIKKSFFYILMVYVPVATLVTISNNFFVKDDRSAAILLSGYAFSEYDYWASPSAFLGSYPVWTFYFNVQGMRADYFLNATKNDLKEVLLNPRYQSIVLVGHGSKNVWRATDQNVTNDDIKHWQPLFEKKTGEWLQLSCPTLDVYPEHIGELVMVDKKNVFYYSGEKVGSLTFVVDALSGFRLIKYQTRMRRGEN